MNEKMFRERVKRFIDDNALLQKGDRILVALSGGADSVCLLLILKELGYDILAAHCNFHLRGEESMRDEAFVRNLCEQTGVKLSTTDFDTIDYAKEKGISIELAARDLRYNYFKTIMNEEKCTALAVGHHKDDNAETFILNCIRKTGVRGLGGIKANSMNVQGCRVIRPLLCMDREEIVNYLKDKEANWVTDSTNLKADVARNKVRLEVMPVLKDINAGAVGNLCDTMQNFVELDKIYKSWADEEKKRCARWDCDDTLTIIRERVANSISPISVMHELLGPLGFNQTQIKNLLIQKGYKSNRQKGGYEMILQGGRKVQMEVTWKVIRIREIQQKQ